MSMVSYEQGDVGRPGPLGRVRRAYERWREDRDIIAIVATLYRLSDRRLALIGLTRDRLVDDVERMMAETAASQAIAAEVIELLGRGEGRVTVDHRSATAGLAGRGAA